MNELTFIDGAPVPRIGQGTWHMGERDSLRGREVDALRQGVDLGMRLIDTAEMYGEGGAEKVVGEAIRDCREQVYLVSKVYPHNASREGVAKACERSLQRLDCDYLDLYLLHWEGRYPLAETVDAFEQLREAGKIRAWGVSNLDVDALEVLDSDRLARCATNQVMYNPATRGIEFDLLPWSQSRKMPLMAYCPLGGQGRGFLGHPVLEEIAERHAASTAQVALAWVLRHPGMVAIPKALDPRHVEDNAAAARLDLTADDLSRIDAVLPGPTGKTSLSIV